MRKTRNQQLPLAEATAEQVVRAAIIKQAEGYSYRELAFHLADSRAYSLFCKIGIGKPFKKSALQRGIKAISDKTWEQINRILIGLPLGLCGTPFVDKRLKANLT